MMNEYKLSIVIPHYQSFCSLRGCLNSIPIDKYIQIIVIDDASPDWEKMESSFRTDYPHITFVSLLKNSGAGAARNAGLDLALGKWLMFADADDYFVNSAFDEVICKHYEDCSDIIFYKATSINIETGEISDRHQQINTYVDEYDPQNIESEDNLRYRFYGPVCKMVRRQVVLQHHIRFDEVKYSNDVMFSVKIGYHAKHINVVKQEIYCITTSSNSLTRKMTAGALMCRYSVAIRYNNYLSRIGKKKCRTILLRYFVLAFKYDASCFVPMIKIGLKSKVNFFAGMSRVCKILLSNRKQFSHF